MKRILAIILSAAILASCGSKLPAGMNQATYDLGIEALSICEDFIQEKIGADDFHQKIKGVSEKLDSVDYKTDEEGATIASMSLNLNFMQMAEIDDEFFDLNVLYEELKEKLNK